MIEAKEERRREVRRRTFKSARIVFNSRQSTIDCIVRNLSEHGALLVVPTSLGVPKEFELWLDDVTHLARVVWRAGDRMGVTWSQ